LGRCAGGLLFKGLEAYAGAYEGEVVAEHDGAHGGDDGEDVDAVVVDFGWGGGGGLEGVGWRMLHFCGWGGPGV
jgi:hypothetical protein